MRNTLLLFCLSAVLFGCKDKETLTPYYDPNSGELDFVIEGLKDTTIEQQGDIFAPLYVKKISGTPSSVKLNATDLPKGVSITFDPESSAPPFNTFITIKTNRTPVGEYPITVTGFSDASGSKKFSFKLRVTPYSNAALGILGDFIETHNCSQGGNSSFDVNIIEDETTNNKVFIKGFWSGVWTNQVYATVNPDTKQISIPKQTTNGIEFTGSGTYSDNEITITYSAVGKSGTVNDNCTAVLKRK